MIERALILGDAGRPIEVADLQADSVPEESGRGLMLSGSLATLRCAKRANCSSANTCWRRSTALAGNISRTASFVGMERSALHRKLKSLGVNTARLSAKG